MFEEHYDETLAHEPAQQQPRPGHRDALVPRAHARGVRGGRRRWTTRKIAKPTKETGSGTGAVEAPRGTLYHHYEIKDGLIEVADIITPTAQNLDDIEMHMKLCAERMLAEDKKRRGGQARARDGGEGVRPMHKLRDAPGDAEAGLRSRARGRSPARGRCTSSGWAYTDKADDGAGILVAQALKKRFPSYSILEHDGVEGVVLDICESPGPGTVFFVDAADLHREPGTVRVVRSEDIHDREITTHRVAVALLGGDARAVGEARRASSASSQGPSSSGQLCQSPSSRLSDTWLPPCKGSWQTGTERTDEWLERLADRHGPECRRGGTEGNHI